MTPATVSNNPPPLDGLSCRLGLSRLEPLSIINIEARSGKDLTGEHLVEQDVHTFAGLSHGYMHSTITQLSPST